MKRTIAILLCIALMFTLCACGPSDEDIQAVRDVSFDGAELTVTLGTNKSTGYEWDYEIYGESIEETTGRSFKVTGTEGDATGEVSIVFKGTSEGKAAIVFTTPNGWDGTGEGDAYTVSASVSGDGTILSASGEEGNTYAASAPVSSTDSELLSAPYAEMLMSGEYQYSYSLTYDGAEYKAIIAAKNGMASRSVISDDGSYSQRVVTIDGNAWQVNDLTGDVVDLGTELVANGAEELPDYATLSFAAARTLDTGAIAEAYDFEYQGQACNMIFVFDADETLVEIVMTVGDTTSEMFIIEMSSPADATLFDAPIS